MAKNNVQKFKHSVKPYYYPTDECFIVHSPQEKLSESTEFVALSAREVKREFGFNLICGDLVKSANEAFKYLSDNHLKLSYPASLEPLKDNKPPEIYSNTNEIFILHKSPSNMGLEVVSGGNLAKGFVIAEYLGERLPLNEIVSDDTYLLLNPESSNIDAKYYGNIARFFNHCPNEHSNPNVLTANLLVVSWPVSKTLTKMFFITTREIQPFEPICWDYGSKYEFSQPMELLDVNMYGLLRDESDTM